MFVPSDAVQRAIEDLTIIRKAIDSSRSHSERTDRALLLSNRVHLLVISSALLVAFLLLITELTLDGIHTSTFLASSYDTNIRFAGLLNAALFLLIGSGLVYFIAYRAARRSDMSLENFIALNFEYLRNMSFLSDLFLKFSFFSAIIIAGKPEWVAPLLCVFIADYLVQGRFFVLPLMSSYALAVISFGIAALQISLKSISVGIPLALFCLACIFSLVHLKRNICSQGDDVQEDAS